MRGWSQEVLPVDSVHGDCLWSNHHPVAILASEVTPALNDSTVLSFWVSQLETDPNPCSEICVPNIFHQSHLLVGNRHHPLADLQELFVDFLCKLVVNCHRAGLEVGSCPVGAQTSLTHARAS